MAIFAQIEKDLKEGKLAPVYLVLGTEMALKERFKKDLEKQITEDLNQLTIDLNEQPLSDGLLEASSMPFFGDRRFVFLNNPTFLTGSPNQSGPTHDLDALMEYLKSPVETTVLVFFAPYEKLDERKKVVKALKKSAVLVDVSPLKESQVREYLTEEMKKLNLHFTPEAKERLLLLTQFDLSALESELDKLSIYQKGNQEITEEVVNQLVPRTLRDDVFSLTQYLLKGEVQQAFQLYEDLKTSGEELVKINGILISQIRLYVQVKIMVEKRLRKEEMASLLKVHPYRIKLAIEGVKNLSLRNLGHLLDDLVEQDFQMKQSNGDKELNFEVFLLKHSAN